MRSAPQPVNAKISTRAALLLAVTISVLSARPAFAVPEANPRPKPIGFRRVGGQDRAVSLLTEHIVKPILSHRLMEHLLPEQDPTRGVLFTGPKGVGKTLAAKALAEELRVVHQIGESDLYFRPYEATSLMGSSAKETAENVKAAFDEARQAVEGGAKRALIYIDELDALVRNRKRDSSWDAAVVAGAFNEALNGIASADKIVLLASTNHSEQIDHALRRGGRIDLEIPFGLPDTGARESILGIHTARMPLASDVNLTALAIDTPGFAGADLMSMVKRAAVKANARVAEQHPELLGDNPPAAELERHGRVASVDFEAARQEIEPSGLREHKVDHVKVAWDEIAGIDEAVTRVKALVSDVRRDKSQPNRFKVKPSRGGLLIGLPGGGKTLLSKAAATEMGGNILYVRGSDIRNSLYGESAQQLRQRFDLARQQAPIVMVIDEIETVIPRRGAGGPTELTETDAIIGEALAQLDGFEKLDNVLVLATTNRPEMLDDAILERFPTKIHVPMQNQKGRQVLIQKWLDQRKDVIGSDVSASDLAAKTERYSARAIIQLLDEAARRADRAHADHLTAAQIEQVRKETRPSVTQQQLDEAARLVSAFTGTGTSSADTTNVAPGVSSPAETRW